MRLDRGSARSSVLARMAEDVTDPFRFQAHVDVWLLVAGLTAGYVYMVRVVGPPPSPPDNRSSPGAT